MVRPYFAAQPAGVTHQLTGVAHDAAVADGWLCMKFIDGEKRERIVATICSICATVDSAHDSLYARLVRRILLLPNRKRDSSNVGTRIAERSAWYRHMIDSSTIDPMEAAK